MTRLTRAASLRASLVAFGLTLLLGLAVAGCGGDSEIVAREKQRLAAQVVHDSAPCADSATLMSTASGSPSGAACESRQRIQVTLGASSGGNGFALAVCRCVADGGAK